MYKSLQLACFLAIVTPVAVMAAGPAAPAGVATLGLTFDEEFDKFISSPDGSVGWMTAYQYEGQAARALTGNNHEAEYYSDSSVGRSPFQVQNGILNISASRAYPGSNPYHLPFISGLLTTLKSFSQVYGYFEISVKLPAGKGLWPAFWMLPVDVDYYSELDIFEVLGDAPGTLYASTHHRFQANDWYTNLQKLRVANTSTDFHTYGADWEPDTTTFYMDGKVIATAPTPPTMNKPMYILANLAVGGAGSWPGEPDEQTTFPATMQIDYIRAFASANTINVGGTEANKTAAITGQVRRANLNQSGVVLSLRDARDQEIATTVSDAGGQFAFRGLPAGAYRLRAADQTGERIMLGAGQTVSQSLGF
jgi:beta-glucanase (GH16 family)